jgi:hypothetical protein
MPQGDMFGCKFVPRAFGRMYAPPGLRRLHDRAGGQRD